VPAGVGGAGVNRKAAALTNLGVAYGELGNLPRAVTFQLNALDVTTGEEKWKFQTAASVGTPVICDGVAYFGSADTYMCAAK
jgi:outer membrane protein assembly factor BamB